MSLEKCSETRQNLLNSLNFCIEENAVSVIVNSRVLVVGAGGIGCELLKNLVLSGFQYLHVIDLDTVDPTNLNRQFLFNKTHIGQSKAEAARTAVLKLCPWISITAHHKNIKDPEFSSEFFQSFDLILNALDNNDARRFVNRLCISLDIPFIDSGSTGYNGQVTPILGNVTTCFECNPLPRHKSFPICTIRSTPQKPEHCIAWAKYLFELMFGPENEGNVLSDLKQQLLFQDKFTESSAKNEQLAFRFAQKNFQHIFDEDITKQGNLRSNWLEGQRPTALTTTEYFDVTTHQLHQPLPNLTELSRPTRREPWTIVDCVGVFVLSVSNILLQRSKSVGCLVFDKDDPVAMDFVTAAANLRMYNYHIPPLSRWDAESIAGAIIPAIASTNAMVAGLQVLQAIQLLRLREKVKQTGQQLLSPEILQDNGVKHVWVKQYSLGPYLLLPETLDPPKENCYICQSHKLILRLHSLREWTLASFVKIILNDELACKEPVVELSSTQLCIYDPDMEEDDEDFAEKKRCSLALWGVQSGGSVFVVDIIQETFECEIQIIEDPSLQALETEQLRQDKFGTDERNGTSDDASEIPLTRLYRLERCQTGKGKEGGKRDRSGTNHMEKSPKRRTTNGAESIVTEVAESREQHCLPSANKVSRRAEECETNHDKSPKHGKVHLGDVAISSDQDVERGNILDMQGEAESDDDISIINEPLMPRGEARVRNVDGVPPEHLEKESSVVETPDIIIIED